MKRLEQFHSPANGRAFPVLIWTPDGCPASEADVAVFLHGRQPTDDYAAETLTRLYPWDESLQRAADGFGASIVIPLLGNKAHLDSPIDPTVRRAVFLGQELPMLVAGALGVAHRRTRWSIHGFSMGGTGALNVLARYADIYAIATNFGGNCDPAFQARVMKKRCPAEDVLGPYPESAANFDQWSNASAILRLRGRRDVAIAFGCGQEDVRLDIIRCTRDLAQEAGLAVLYTDYPGGHVYDASHMMLQLAAAAALRPLLHCEGGNG